MTAAEGPKSAGLVARVQNILMRPAAEWDAIEAEPATVQSLYTGYAVILAAIPPVASVVGAVVGGHSPVAAVVLAVLSYVLSLVGVFVVSFIIDALAPSFDGQKNQVQATKLVVYANTAVWVAGVGQIIPVLGGVISLLGLLYTLYLTYVGLPKLMKSPPDKTVGYFIVSLLVAVGFYFVVAIVIAMIATMVAVGALATGAAAVGTMPH